ncbi:MAG: tripartite tricarboxylate transporter substrate binding protein [Burkholderiales bacterium]|jgi:tripartite-type tricarboxylate transporter receptor subunit TctC
MTPTHPTRRRALQALAALSLPAAPFAASAQDKVVKFILPNATGSGVDAITRAMAPAFSKAIGASVIVENQPGAGGIVGLQQLVRAAPDGATLSVVSNNVAIFPSIHKTLPFAMPDDFTPIAILGTTPLVMVATPKLGVSNARELATVLKAKGDAITYASSGAGTILHLAPAMFLDEFGLQSRHIPYKGVGPMVTDLLGGHVDWGIAALPSVAQHVKSGALKALGVVADKRLAAAPDIPTFAEQGFGKFRTEAWFAMLGPKGMSAADVQRVHAAIVAAFAAPETKEQMDRQGNVIDITSTETAQKQVRSEIARYGAISKKIGLEAQ